MKVTAIIVNYFTASFLPSLLKILNNELHIGSIVIADNSNEPELVNVAAMYSKVKMVVFSENIGFAKAVNRAAENSDCDWFLVINPDTLPEEGFLEKLINGAEKTNAFIAGPRFFWDDEKTFRLPPALGYSWTTHAGMISAGHFELESKLRSFNWSLRHDRFWNQPEPFFEPFLQGACMLIKNDSSLLINGKIFDERYFLYYEDTDLCAEFLKAGKNIICVPDSKVVHYWDQSPSPNKSKLMAESNDLYRVKHFGCKYPAIETSSVFNENFSDLGEVRIPPIFEFPGNVEYPVIFFEFGLNPFFVPFAQADFVPPVFRFPETIWQGLSKGTFYTRLRAPVLNKILKMWKWKKL